MTFAQVGLFIGASALHINLAYLAFRSVYVTVHGACQNLHDYVCFLPLLSLPVSYACVRCSPPHPSKSPWLFWVCSLELPSSIAVNPLRCLLYRRLMLTLSSLLDTLSHSYFFYPLPILCFLLWDADHGDHSVMRYRWLLRLAFQFILVHPSPVNDLAGFLEVILNTVWFYIICCTV